jgi:hypothetical protein
MSEDDLADDGDGNGTETHADADDAEAHDATVGGFSRRSLIQAAGIAGLLGVGAGTASADASGQLGTADRPLRTLYTQRLAGGLTGGQNVTGLTGTGLDVESGTLSAAAAAGDHVDVTAAGETVAADADELAAGAHLTASVDGDDTVTLDAEMPAVTDSTRPVVEDTLTLNFNQNLTVVDDGEGTVRVDATDPISDSRTDVSDDATTVVSDVQDIDFGTNLTASDDGDGTATVTANVSGATNWEDANGLLETASGYSGIDVTDVRTDSLNGPVTGGKDLTDLQGGGLTIAGGSLDLEHDSVTVTAGTGLKGGGAVSLGGSTLLSVEPADFAGTTLEDDGSDTLTVSSGGIGTDELNTPFSDLSTLVGGPVTAGSDIDLAEDTLVDTTGALSIDGGGSGVNIDGDTITLASEKGCVVRANASGQAGSLSVVDESYNTQLDVSSGGSIEAPNIGTGTGTTLVQDGDKIVRDSSSARYKTDIEPLATPAGCVLDLEPRSFAFEDSGESDVGLIAEEVEGVLPELVTYDGEGRPEGVKYRRLGVLLIPEVREHRERIAGVERDGVDREERVEDLEAETETLREENDRLRERNADLEARLDALEERVEQLADDER